METTLILISVCVAAAILGVYTALMLRHRTKNRHATPVTEDTQTPPPAKSRAADATAENTREQDSTVPAQEAAAPTTPVAVRKRVRAMTDKERWVKRDNFNKDTMHRLQQIGINVTTQERVVKLYPTKQRIYLYLAEHRGAKGTEISRDLKIPVSTLDKAMAQLIKEDSLVLGPKSKQYDKYYALKVEMNGTPTFSKID